VNKKRLVFIIIIFMGLAAGGAYMWWASKQDGAQENELVLYGNVDIREVRLAFNGSEHVGSVLVDEGDPVKAGQLVATLHKDRLEATWERARAEVAAAEAEAHAAQLSYERIKSLTASKLASKEQADEAQAQSLAADARVNAAKAALDETAQALKDAELYTPVDGIVRERIVEPGDFVTPQTPVLTLALTNPVWVRTYLPESYLGQIKPGAKAQITTDSYPGKVYKGWVGSISPTAEFTPKNVETPELRTRLVYQVRVFACNPQHELRLGMPATVTIPLGQHVTTESAPDKQCGSSVQKNHGN